MKKIVVKKLKQILLIMLCLTGLYIKLRSEILNEKFTLKTISTWKDFNNDSKSQLTIEDQEKKALTVELIFRSKETIKLKKLVLQWNGDFLDDISASLYQKKENDDLTFINKNFVCDAKWDNKKQQIIFTLDEKLIAINKYYLIINYMPKIESKLKEGCFVLSNEKAIQICSI